jgi:hypothetical protein
MGFGNLSVRIDRERFLITGSGTGILLNLTVDELAIVTQTDIAKNWLACAGRVHASSESLTHAAIYQACPQVQVVAHTHSAKIYERNKNRMPLTSAAAQYGTVAIAQAVFEIASKMGPDYQGLILMAGHFPGIFSYGMDFQQVIRQINQP